MKNVGKFVSKGENSQQTSQEHTHDPKLPLWREAQIRYKPQRDDQNVQVQD